MNKVSLKKLFSNFAGSDFMTLIKVYDNLLNNKSKIINSNKNKIGIYLWFNNLTEDFYIGS